jgi:hypothetical protein
VKIPNDAMGIGANFLISTDEVRSKKKDKLKNNVLTL